MAVKDVQKIPVTYKAVQWGCKRESAGDLSDLLMSVPNNSYAYWDDDYEFAYVQVYRKNGGSDNYTLSLDMWVVVSSKGKVEVLSDWDYADKYEEKVKGE